MELNYGANERMGYSVTNVLAGGSVVANLATLLAIAVSNRGLTSNLRLIISLSLSDILTGTCALLINWRDDDTWASPREACSLEIVKRFRVASHLISLLNLICMACDRYYAVLHPLKHRMRLNVVKVRLIITVLWVLPILASFIDFIVPWPRYPHCRSNPGFLEICEMVWCSRYKSDQLLMCVAVVVLVSMMVLYVVICLKIYHFREFDHSARGRSIWRNKRALLTTLIIIATFMFCWLPYCSFELYTLLYFMAETTPEWLDMIPFIKKMDLALYNLILVNSLADPLIYAARMTEIQAGYGRIRNLMFCRTIPQMFRSNLASGELQDDSRRNVETRMNRSTNWSPETSLGRSKRFLNARNIN